MEILVKIIYGNGKNPFHSVMTGAIVLVALMLLPAFIMGVLFLVYTTVNPVIVFIISYIFFVGVCMIWYYNTIETLAPYTMHFILCFGKKTKYYVKDGKWPQFPPFITFMKGEDSISLGSQIGETEEFCPTSLDGKKYRVKIKYAYVILEDQAYKFTKAHKKTFEEILSTGLANDTRTLVTTNKHEDENSILRKNFGNFKAEILKLKDYEDLTKTYGCNMTQFEFITFELEDEEDKDADAELTRENSHQRTQMAKVNAANQQIKEIMTSQNISFEKAKDVWELATNKKTKTEINNTGNGNGINLLNIGTDKK